MLLRRMPRNPEAAAMAKETVERDGWKAVATLGLPIATAGTLVVCTAGSLSPFSLGTNTCMILHVQLLGLSYGMSI